MGAYAVSVRLFGTVGNYALLPNIGRVFVVNPSPNKKNPIIFTKPQGPDFGCWVTKNPLSKDFNSLW